MEVIETGRDPEEAHRKQGEREDALGEHREATSLEEPMGKGGGQLRDERFTVCWQS